MQTAPLLQLLYKEIPLSQHMQITLLRADTDKIALGLPLSPNKNHKGTLFGGSLYSGCALACYALFLSGLQQHGFSTQDIVIGDGHIRYRRPVTRDTVVTATWPSPDEKALFFETLRSKSKARINLRAVIEEDGKQCCEFVGRFVAVQTA